jgi:Tfp pilus assembly protein PilN
VRPINLIPQSERPARATGSKSGSAYVVIGVLAGLLVFVGLYVLTSNQVNTRKEEAVEAKKEAAQAEARAGALGAFGDFSSVKATRTASVRAVAGSRFDWERLIRELAHVLPEKTFLSEMDASVSQQEGEDAGAEAATLRAVSGGPQAKLKGCARGQSDVAKLMVRLRQMHGVEDVGLSQSTRGDSEGGGGESEGNAPSSGASADCGPLYEFELVVAFKPVSTPESGDERQGRVPARLGGGS